MKVIHLFRTSVAGYGLERNILCTLPGLVKRGIEVVAVAVKEKNSGHVPGGFAEQLEAAGVRLIGARSTGRLPLALARRFSQIFRAEAPDIIHSHGYKCDFAMLLAKTGNAVRMTSVHGWLSRNIRERFYEWINVQCCKRMACVIVFCEDYRTRLVSRGVPEQLLCVAPVGLDTSVVPAAGIDFRERWGVSEDEVLIAQLGRLSPEKHPELFVEVALSLSDRFRQARFVLVGEGPMLEALKRQARPRGKPSPVIFAGYVHEVADVLEAIDIAVNCSSTEGLPRTLLEAGAARVPVVATAVGGVPDVVEDGSTGLLCPAGDSAALGAGIARLIEDAELRRRMGAAAQERVRAAFSADACAERLIQLYDSLVPNAGANP